VAIGNSGSGSPSNIPPAIGSSLRFVFFVFLRCLLSETSRGVMSTHVFVLVDSVGPPSAEVCRAAASFP
jgi:hypothetical protein